MTDWNEHVDAISDVISDSIDVNWNSRTGAKAVVVWLNENAAAPSSLAGREKHVAAARFARLYGIVRRILWTDASTPSLEGASGQALSDLAELHVPTPPYPRKLQRGRRQPLL